MLLGEYQHTRNDDTIECRKLACCARLRCERIDEVRGIVQNDHKTVLAGAGAACRRSNAHPHCGIDKCVQRGLNRRAVLRAAHSPSPSSPA